jgi:hypothetical protein
MWELLKRYRTPVLWFVLVWMVTVTVWLIYGAVIHL